MKVLKVLALRKVSLSLEDLQFLPNLRTLRLEQCALQNVSSLGNLKGLEILVISYSLQEENHEELFRGLTGLTTLKLLDISDNHPYEVWTLPKNFLSSLVQLEELYLPRRIKWARISEDSTDTAGISELCSLSHLTQLSRVELSPECIPNKFVFPPLQRYDLYVHVRLRFNPYSRSSRRLTIRKSSLINTFKKLFCNVEELDLSAIMDLEYLIDTTKEQVPNSVFSNLMRLTLHNMICLKELWHGLPPIGFLHMLEYLTINSCNKLKSIFSVSIAQTLVHLKGLDVSDCDGVEKVFYCEEETDDGEDITLPQLHTLELKGLRSLRKFCSEKYFVKLPSLKKLAVRYCGQLTHFKDEVEVTAWKDELETLDVDGHVLKELFWNWKDLTLLKKSQKSLAAYAIQGRLNEVTLLKLEACEDLEQTQELNNDDQSPKRLLPKLKELKVRNCKDMLSVLPAIINLKKVIAGSSVRLQVIFQLQGEGEENIQEMLLLSNLKELKLELLPELKCIWKGPTHHVNLQRLKVMIIDMCHKLAFLFSPSLAQTLLHLEELQIRDCEELEHIISTEVESDDDGTVSNPCFYPPICWPQLKTLKITSCRKLEYVFPITLAQGLQQLERIEISHSPQLKQVFNNIAKEEDNGHDILLPHLQYLVLECLGNFSSLCPRNYFVMSPPLKRFHVLFCPKWVRLGNTQVPQAQSKVFQLYAFKEMICCSKNLTLNRSNWCQNLIPDVDPEGLNELQFLYLHNFGNVECLYNTTEHRQPTIAFSNLVELLMEEMTGLKKLCNNQPPKGFLQKLEKLKITNCMNLASLSPMGQNLKEVKIKSCCQLREIFEVDEILRNSEANEAPTPLMSDLTCLELELLSELRCIWKGPSHSVINLESLKIIKISNCKRLRCLFSSYLVKSLVHLEQLILHDLPELEQLITEQGSDAEQEQQALNMAKGPSHSVINLRSLKIIKISNCKRLRRLFSLSLVKSLVVLQQLILHDLPELVQLITDLGSDVEQEQHVFNMVKEKVDGHGQHKYSLPFQPSWEFEVSKCPKLRPIIIQQEVNDQAQVKGLYLSNRQCNSFNVLLRQSLPHLTVGNHLQFLQWLIMSNCSKLKSLFPRLLAESLPHLRYLRIEQCDELEQIIDKDETSASSSQGHLQPICFPSLTEICIEGCNSLKSLFSVTVALSLSQLKWFTIRGASKLEQVFEYQGGIDIEDTEKEIVLPQLRRLSLEELPRLQSFIPMGYHCSFQQLCSFKVKECPNLTTSFRVDSKHTIHAKTEAVGNSPMKNPNTDVDVMEGSASDEDVRKGFETTWPVGSDINWPRF
ncbi:hypothetical protein PTKIN_Ptkin11bG0175700 [Pterospermum kingtungense]